jgi:hypothetical protein
MTWSRTAPQSHLERTSDGDEKRGMRELVIAAPRITTPPTRKSGTTSVTTVNVLEVRVRRASRRSLLFAQKRLAGHVVPARLFRSRSRSSRRATPRAGFELEEDSLRSSSRVRIRRYLSALAGVEHTLRGARRGTRAEKPSRVASLAAHSVRRSHVPRRSLRSRLAIAPRSGYSRNSLRSFLAKPRARY